MRSRVPLALAVVAVFGLPIAAWREASIGVDAAERDLAHAALIAAFALGWWTVLWGLARVRAGGPGPGSRAVLGAATVIVGVAALQPLLDAAALAAGPAWRGGAFYTLADLAWPLGMTWMLAVGAVCARAGVLPGAWRWAPLAGGLAAPLWLVVGALRGAYLPLPGALHVALAWALVGVALLALGGPGTRRTAGYEAGRAG